MQYVGTATNGPILQRFITGGVAEQMRREVYDWSGQEGLRGWSVILWI